MQYESGAMESTRENASAGEMVHFLVLHFLI